MHQIIIISRIIIENIILQDIMVSALKMNVFTNRM